MSQPEHGITNSNNTEGGEKLPISISSSLLLSTDSFSIWDKRLVLVQQNDNGKFGLVAGSLEFKPEQSLVETAQGTIKRELTEETDITPDQIFDIYHFTELYLPQKNKFSIGFVFKAKVSEHLYDFEKGYEPTNKEEIINVQGFTLDQLSDIIRESPQIIYKPQYNIPLIKYWAYYQVFDKYSVYDSEEFGHLVAEGRTGFDRSCLNIHHKLLSDLTSN